MRLHLQTLYQHLKTIINMGHGHHQLEITTEAGQDYSLDLCALLLLMAKPLSFSQDETVDLGARFIGEWIAAPPHPRAAYPLYQIRPDLNNRQLLSFYEAQGIIKRVIGDLEANGVNTLYYSLNVPLANRNVQPLQ